VNSELLARYAASRVLASKKPASILVVDDTPANLQVLSGMLKERGYRVRPAPGGKLALQAAGREPPDLILLDINMPDMNGYEVCDRLKADEKLAGIPVIFISALTEPLDKVKAFATGGVDYLTKPFQMEELHARVETHLKIRRLQLDLERHARELESARDLIKFDLDLAHDVQRGLLPAKCPEMPGYEFAAYYEAASEVGGDYYDFIPMPGRRMAVLLGDVAGKGVAAALLMAKLTADARSCMMTEADPATAFDKLNIVMNRADIGRNFVTLLAIVIDPADNTATMVNAAHPSPLIYRRATGDVIEAVGVEMTGLPLGPFDGFQYPSALISLEPGDCVLAFTDGVTEAMNVQGEQLGITGVRAALEGRSQTPGAMVEAVSLAVKKFAAGRQQNDDITLVAFGRRES
jgi:serine phosphatase RsbU (regulator of sigma subunit)